MNDQQRAAMQMALENICGAKLCEINSMSSRAEMIRLMDGAITALREALAQPIPKEITVFEGYISSAQIEALQKALAQPQGEPVAWAYFKDGKITAVEVGKPADAYSLSGDKPTPLYTAPPSVEAAIEATKEKAAKVCDGFERKKWEILAKGGVAAGLSPADCAAAIRSME